MKKTIGSPLRPPPIEELLGKHVLITGEVGSGKSILTASLIRDAQSLGHSREMAILDFAPEPISVGGRRIGGRITNHITPEKPVLYLAPQGLVAARLNSSSAEQLLEASRSNASKIDEALLIYLSSLRPITFVNDVTMYLLAGSLNRIYSLLEGSPTVVMNGYRGTLLASNHGTGVSTREAESLKRLAKRMDLVIELEREARTVEHKGEASG